MSSPGPFDAPPEDTHSEMMRATYDALRKHGYAELTIQRIGEEFPKSKSLVYQHYDSKDELLVDFLELMLDHFESDARGERRRDPRERLRRVLDRTLSAAPDEEQEAFTRALTALRGEAPFNAAFRGRFTQADAGFRARVADIVADGIEAGVFRDADAERVAEFVVTSIHGAMLRRSTTDGAVDVAGVRAELEAYLDRRLDPDRDSDPEADADADAGAE